MHIENIEKLNLFAKERCLYWRSVLYLYSSGVVVFFNDLLEFSFTRQ